MDIVQIPSFAFSGGLQAQQTEELTGSEKCPSKRDFSGHSLLQSKRAQRISLRTIVYRVTRELVQGILVFHPRCNLGQ